jgi:RHS repeat-associated protein
MNRWFLAAIAVILCLHPSSAFAQETVIYYTTDAIGSVRMITDANGQVVERHDYLPFGEEYPLTQQPPSVEKRLFGGNEHDQETGFEYSLARYYASGTGRFTNVDSFLDIRSSLVNPQKWNRYAYVLNNPLRYIDPSGMYEWAANCDGDTTCEENRQKFRDAVSRIQDAFARTREGTDEYTELNAVLNRLGTEGDGNNIKVAFDPNLSAFGSTPLVGRGRTMTLNFTFLERSVTPASAADARAALVVHEGRHTLQYNPFSAVAYTLGRKIPVERAAYNAESLFYKAINTREPFGPLWDPSWTAATQEMQRRAAIEMYLRRQYGK